LTVLHGFTQNAKIFDRQRAYFEGAYRVASPELLGHGARDVDTDDYSVPALAADVLAQLRERGVERTHFWGTHTGTAVGLVLALERPSLIASLVLEAPVVPGIDMPVVAGRLARARTLARTQGVRDAMADWFDHAEWFRSIRERRQEHRAAAQRDIVLEFPGRPLVREPPSGAFSLVERVRDIACPVLVYHGGDDIDDFKRTASWLSEELPAVERAELDGLGGFPAWEAPDRVNALVERFLAGSGREATQRGAPAAHSVHQ